MTSRVVSRLGPSKLFEMTCGLETDLVLSSGSNHRLNMSLAARLIKLSCWLDAKAWTWTRCAGGRRRSRNTCSYAGSLRRSVTARTSSMRNSAPEWRPRLQHAGLLRQLEPVALDWPAGVRETLHRSPALEGGHGRLLVLSPPPLAGSSRTPRVTPRALATGPDLALTSTNASAGVGSSPVAPTIPRPAWREVSGTTDPAARVPSSTQLQSIGPNFSGISRFAPSI